MTGAPIVSWLMEGDPSALQNKHSGETHFDMEKPGEPSRWNTLRALRVLRWWGDGETA